LKGVKGVEAMPYICHGCGATVEFVMEGGKPILPSEMAEALVGTLKEALARLPLGTDMQVIARIQGVIQTLETNRV
jgi:hypothetical protein